MTSVPRATARPPRTSVKRARPGAAAVASSGRLDGLLLSRHARRVNAGSPDPAGVTSAGADPASAPRTMRASVAARDDVFMTRSFRPPEARHIAETPNPRPQALEPADP